VRILLDTNLLIAPPQWDLLPDGDHVLVTSAVSYAELAEGEFSDNPAVRSRAPLDLLRARQLYGLGLPFDDAAALAYRLVCDAVFEHGRSVGRARRADLMIAATALAHECVVATRNGSDFAGLENLLKVITL